MSNLHGVSHGSSKQISILLTAVWFLSLRYTKPRKT